MYGDVAELQTYRRRQEIEVEKVNEKREDERLPIFHRSPTFVHSSSSRLSFPNCNQNLNQPPTFDIKYHKKICESESVFNKVSHY